MAVVKTVVRDKDGLILRSIETDETDPLLPLLQAKESALAIQLEQNALLDRELRKEITALREANDKSEKMVAGLLVELRKTSEALENLREAQRRRFSESAAILRARETKKRRKLIGLGFNALEVERALNYEANS